jgi:hypothetical protein
MRRIDKTVLVLGFYQFDAFAIAKKRGVKSGNDGLGVERRQTNSCGCSRTYYFPFVIRHRRVLLVTVLNVAGAILDALLGWAVLKKRFVKTGIV